MKAFSEAKNIRLIKTDKQHLEIILPAVSAKVLSLTQ